MQSWEFGRPKGSALSKFELQCEQMNTHNSQVEGAGTMGENRLRGGGNCLKGEFGQLSGGNPLSRGTTQLGMGNTMKTVA